ncbi:hypothetical protein SCLCIDRAFT_1221612 [Scleroderma citrinum Foug A]|uniref:Uncharacterized protein n=1 Tax=Scleroderma citrinum Foug A TaxID=1036808 RepID=A0A0C3D242_9AGAM|nr:hypothetical protein SCLCIDRAFT_1221612 [Scleroderma citrinum Foug A]
MFLPRRDQHLPWGQAAERIANDTCDSSTSLIYILARIFGTRINARFLDVMPSPPHIQHRVTCWLR